VHEWQLERTERLNSQGGAAIKQDTNIGSCVSECSDRATYSNFCSLCGAWRGELGLEPTIELYISHLILIFNEVKRVLKKTGSCWINLGDSYAGSGKASGQNIEQVTVKQASNFASAHINLDAGIPSKSLCAIPERFVLAMMDNGWIYRQDIIWHKNNPMPESVKDRFTDTWEHLYFFVKSRRYYFEQQFEPIQYLEPRWGRNPKYDEQQGGLSDYNSAEHSLGRNKRNLWTINTQPCPEAHFATFPEKLCETPILAGCPSMICKKCGKTREKIYETDNHTRTRKTGEGQDTEIGTKGRAGESDLIDKGYSDCGCNAGWEAGIVLDPFNGRGTTQIVAKKLGRKSIGIDLNSDYCELAENELQKITTPMGLGL